MRYDRFSPEGRIANAPLVGDDAEDFPFCVLWQIKGDLDFYDKDFHCFECLDFLSGPFKRFAKC